MKTRTLYLAWRDPSQPAWHTIGRLQVTDRTDDGHLYSFGYTRGFEQSGLPPLANFPDTHREYVSSALFPFFDNRVLNGKRQEFSKYVSSLLLDPNYADPVQILDRSGGHKVTDSYFVYPLVEPDEHGRFEICVPLRGLNLREPKPDIGQLAPETLVDLRHEVTNTKDADAMAVWWNDKHLGYVPRGYSSGLRKIAARGQVMAQVEKTSVLKGETIVMLRIRGTCLPGDFSSAEQEPLPITSKAL